jgi:hypothetical protein
MTNSAAADPSNRHIAGLGELQEAMKGWVPSDIEAAPGERNARSFSRSAKRRMGASHRLRHDANSVGFPRAEDFGADPIRSDAPTGKPRGKIALKRGRSAKIKICLPAHAQMLQGCHIEAPGGIEEQARFVRRKRPAIAHVRPAVAEPSEQKASFLSEGVLTPIDGSSNPPDHPRR